MASTYEKMENQTGFYFMLFENLGSIRYVFFSLGFVLYGSILLFNVLIILAIFLERTLHRPMYILISCLSLNSVFGTAGFFPRLLTDLLSETHSISRGACILQCFVIYMHTANENSILMLMAFDRFAAICKPLQYHSIITLRFLSLLIIMGLTYSSISLGVGSILASNLTMCGNTLYKVYCQCYEIVKLSCGNNTAINNIIGMFILVTTAVIPLCLILYSYVRILIICKRSSSQFKSKAFQTCVPHIVILLNFSVAIITEIILSRVTTLNLPIWLSVFVSMEFLVVPPILNPLVYALKLPDIRKTILRLVHGFR